MTREARGTATDGPLRFPPHPGYRFALALPGRERETSHQLSQAAKPSASAGQITTHSAQLMQVAGRGSHGRGPAISRQAIGQTATQSPQPVQRVASSTGSSPMAAPAAHQTAHDVG
jgi:hypothetical protein